MPVCPQCDNRSFSNKEALLQHMKSSSAWHPFCSICDRRFVSQPAFEAHMAAKHPPTYDCTTCNRPFHAPFALEDHYRGSTAHPNCGRCGRGFKDDAACAEHHRTAHPKSACIPCTGAGSTPFLVYDDILDQHYWDSPNHPSCPLCMKGFRDTELFNQHRPEAHPELYCRPCNLDFETAEGTQAHLLSSPIHPKCEKCNLGFRDAEARDTHVEEVHTPATAVPEYFSTSTPLNVANHPLAATTRPEEIQALSPSNSASVPLYSTGFTPLSPRNHVQGLIVGDRRTNTPDLRLEAAFASPITEVQPLFSPTGLPRPGGQIDQLWSSRENVQVTPPRFPALSSYSPPIPRSVASHSQPRPLSQSETSSSTSWYEPRTAWRPREGQPFTPAKISSLQSDSGWRAREGSQFSQPQLSPPRSGSEFHPRLYPGSARAASLNRQSPPSSEPTFGRTSRLEDFGKLHRSFGSASASGASISSSFGRPRAPASEPVNWEDLIGPGQAGFSLRGERKSLFDETLTPKAEVAADPMDVNLSLNVQQTPSPSLATVSSPASSALGHSPLYGHYEPDTRPTTASSTQSPSLHYLKPTYTITPSSECASPRSPEVSSPAGLSVLPAISPLASTPTDIPSFDIPEAQKPLPDSPVELSPVTVVVDLKPQSLPIPSTSPLSTSSSQSYITSPQELLEDPVFSTSIETAVTSPVTPVVAPALASASSESAKQNPLHCRVCLADSCDDITASMCGHIFCNRCITDAVIKTSRCPVCMTPTLLYCLFRLDLAA